MHVKVGDNVKVISGKDKGKVGEVAMVITHKSAIVIKDVNLKTKHVKSKGEEEPGQIIKVILSSQFFECRPTIRTWKSNGVMPVHLTLSIALID